MEITISKQVPAQKNDKKMAFNRRTGKPFPVTSKAVKEWQEHAAGELAQYKGQAEGKVSIDYLFFVKDLRRRDTDNMVCTVNDALRKAGLVDDDDWTRLRINSADAELDRDNPRVELIIEENWTKN